MSTFIYLVAEGVADVTLLHRVLGRYFGMEQIKSHSALPEPARVWVPGGKPPKPLAPLVSFLGAILDEDGGES